MRKAAARLGLGLAAASAREKISSCLFMSTSAAAEAVVWKKRGMILGSESESHKEKSLYLCFIESSIGVDGVVSFNHVVRPIRLNSDYDGGGGGGKEEYLQEAAYKRCEGYGEFRFSGRFGSQILFPYGGHISRVDTSTRPIKFEDSTTEFLSPKINPVVVELNGKLYCIDKDNPYRPFEVLDHPEDEWRALDKPPFAMKHSRRPVYSSVLEGSNKILAWVPKENGVFCFDPENGWTESSFSLGLALPFVGNGYNYVLSLYPPLPCHMIVILWNPWGKKPIRLPAKLYSIKPIQNEPIHPFASCTDYELVHLGGQKVCLVLNKFFSRKNTGFLLLITFEYDVKPSKSSTMDIRSRFLWTRRFRYHSKPVDDKEIYLAGAFVL